MSQPTKPAISGEAPQSQFGLATVFVIVMWFACFCYFVAEFGPKNIHFWIPVGIMVSMGAACLIPPIRRQPLASAIVVVIFGVATAISYGPSMGFLIYMVSLWCMVALLRKQSLRMATAWVGVCMLLGLFAFYVERDQALRDIWEAQKRLPIVDLSPRLAFRASPHVAESATAKRWEKLSEQWSNQIWSARNRDLAAIHDKTYLNFVASPGFGIQRMPYRPGNVDLIPLRDVELIDSEDDARHHIWPNKAVAPQEKIYLTGRLLDAETFVPDYWRMYPLAYTPTESVFHYHIAAMNDFASMNTLGYIKSQGHAAGFTQHGFHNAPPDIELKDASSHPSIDSPYRLESLQLVSVLVHSPARVYATAKLPRMDELGEDHPTRPLTAFEQTGLDKLLGGEDLVVSELAVLDASSDRSADHGANETQVTHPFQMIGAVRAMKTCTQCHRAQTGDLLGAFTYRFLPIDTTEASESSSPH